MKIQIPTTKEINVKYLELILPVRYGDEDMPYNFPLRNGDMWQAVVDLETRQIENWPQGQSSKIEMKVCDEGCYKLLDENKQTVLAINQYYVPHGVVPGEYGDYVSLNIDEIGKITNMPKKLDFSEFTHRDDEEED
ncbi:hypothetical protein K7G92_000771 [Pasteurella canis]|uniref:hypothetical protein n=1 Tax=Pasteurella TaxID=745 RepID=UPI001E2CCD29|nr:hypothetical protein [Pasteurella canis]MDY0487291.1 hypothetical protein [Pasteurella multocida]MDY0536765.1 hypothetical protein [Pasteurella multocida]MDY0539182.1 hypothetical protein [Pasteurella multocida]MDY0557461.1 hypothetical protein [Pasteurella multocida]MDY0707920.1 hypothetical protein [Pasteurella multocida]